MIGVNTDNNLNINLLNQIYKAKLSDKDFTKLSLFINKETGIKMHEGKRVMLQNRLYKRLKNLKIGTFKDYCDYLFSSKGLTEIGNMIDVICTNKTSFFREIHHFEFITNYILPLFVNHNIKFIKVWNAGCSSGEEAYTTAMIIQSFIDTIKQSFDYQILATDISTIMLEKAVKAIYCQERIVEIPKELRTRYLLKSINKEKPTVCIIPEIRRKVIFRRLNLMDNAYNIKDKFDIIFCRNVLIYFDKQIQEKVIQKLCQYLKPGGYFFIGHSESLFSMDLPLVHIKPTIFQKFTY